MAYSTGFLNKRIIIAIRAEQQGSEFGKSGQPKYRILGTFWANASYIKGIKKIEEGSLDSLVNKIFRTRYICGVDEWCLVQYQGKWYNLTSCNGDEQKNEMQLTGTLMPNQAVNIVEPNKA